MFSVDDVQTSGKSLPATVAAAQPADQLLVGERAGLEELLHQLLVVLRHHLDQRLARGVDCGGHVAPAPALSVNLPLSSVWNV